MLLPVQTTPKRLQVSNNSSHVRRDTVSPSAIGAFIGATAGVLLLCGLIFFIIHRRYKAKRKQEILAAARARVLAQTENPHILRSNSAARPGDPTYTHGNLRHPTTVPLTRSSNSNAARARLAALTVDPYANRPPQHPPLPTLTSLNEPSIITETSEFDIERRPSPINADHAEYRARKAAELKAQGYSDTDIILASDFSDGVDPYNMRWDAPLGQDPYAMRERMPHQTQTRMQPSQSHAKAPVTVTQRPQPSQTPLKGLAARVSHTLLPSTVYTPPKLTPQPKAQDYQTTPASQIEPAARIAALNRPENRHEATAADERGRSRNRQQGMPGRTPPPDSGRRKQGTRFEDVDIG